MDISTKILNIVAIIAIFMLAKVSYSQIDCPGGGGEWTNATANYNFGRYGPGGSVDFQYRSNGGDYELKVDWGTFQNNSDFAPDGTLKKILEQEAVKDVVPKVQGPYQCNVNVYFVRNCKAKVKLVLELKRGREVDCCDDGATLPSWYEKLIGQETHSFYNIYKYVNCGEKCCRRSYPCERVYDNIKELWVTVVHTPTTESITNCSGDSGLYDCLDGEPIPCEEADCEGYY